MKLKPLPRCLILDYYDSYTNNLLTLFTQLYSDEEVLSKVVVVKADKCDWSSFQREVLPNINCVILSPGPGRPDKPEDIGFALDLIRQHPLPILGVCLGHQAIGVAFGAKIINTPKITHGHVVPITPVPSEMFGGAAEFDAVVYNSLIVDRSTLPACLRVTATSGDIVMGMAHESLPIWSVQYHPESISSTQGSSLLANFLLTVHRSHGDPSHFHPLDRSIRSLCSYQVDRSTSRSHIARLHHQSSESHTASSSSSSSDSSSEASTSIQGCLRYTSKSFTIGHDVPTADVFDRIRTRKGKGKAVGDVWLDGQSSRPTTSSLAAPRFVVTYSMNDRSIRLRTPTETVDRPLEESFWDWFDAVQHRLSAPKAGKGWKAGWIGWFGYEMKQESLGRCREQGSGLDACWSWSDWALERSSDGQWTLHGLLGRSDVLGVTVGMTQSEFDDVFEELERGIREPLEPTAPEPMPGGWHPLTSAMAYRDRIQDCRESIRQGDSYEMTMTTSFEAPRTVDPYHLYLSLRSSNPAYYSAFISFPDIVTPTGKGIHVLSSSPERFLKIENVDSKRMIEMMPIKGTRRRPKKGVCACTDVTGCRLVDPGSAVCEAERRRLDDLAGKELQQDVKERAENLMIVDLIRSDLLSCCIPSTVRVPKLIALESYGVHNLVTTVQGTLGDDVSSVNAVRRCFPPGSMTGAPKLRSVQLLEGYEGRPRGIYSGALGYISADGTTDLSVVIRTIVVEGDRMSLGAGGAITWMSDDVKEWEEVLTKVESVVGSLDSRNSA